MPVKTLCHVKVTYSQISGIRRWTSLRPLFCLPQVAHSGPQGAQVRYCGIEVTSAAEMGQDERLPGKEL